jgi:hypothetical protein
MPSRLSGCVNSFTARVDKIGDDACFPLLAVVRSVPMLPEGGRCFLLRLFQEAILKSIICVALLSLASVTPAPAEKLVDPTSVAPEYREAAEKRRIEQNKQRECAHKADVGKVLPRERTAFLLHCLEAESGSK